MTSLEYIEKVIENMQSMLEHTKTMLKPLKNKINDDLKKHYEQEKKDVEEQIAHLQQIKNELEIMELIKNGWSSMETTLAGDQIMRFQNLKIDDWVKLWNKLEEILLKKALEVSNEKES